MPPMFQLPPLTLRDDLHWDWSRPYWAGIVNCTPDSFSDGGAFLALDDALRHAEVLVDEGADLVDVGGESTRPSGTAISADEEISRVLPFIENFRRLRDTPISIDTTKAEVAKAAILAGADIVNDISGGRFDPEVPAICAEMGAVYISGHVRGQTLQEVHLATVPSFDELKDEIQQQVETLPKGLKGRVIVDPCIGFGKDTKTNLIICSRIGEVRDAVQCPTMVGVSRKRFLGELTGSDVSSRDFETVGASLAAISSGAQILRVHSVSALRHAYKAFNAVILAGRAVDEKSENKRGSG